ncbi:MAG: hypothetical protein V4448_16350, partial [Pseudomonadota bacterium]
SFCFRHYQLSSRTGEVHRKSALIVEIFEATGIAVDKSDPVVLCALLQFRFNKESNTQVIAALNLTTCDLIQMEATSWSLFSDEVKFMQLVRAKHNPSCTDVKIY